MKKKFIIILVIFILIISSIIAYSRYLGTRGLKVKEYKVVSENISEAYNGLKVVHFSDIHYGMTIKYAELEKIVNQINFINPDLVVFTGDLFEKVVDDNMVKELTELFSKIKAKLGKYAINGNHDYDHQSEFNQIISDSDFINLNDTYQLIYNNSYTPILISGISTNTYGETKIEEKIASTLEYLNSENNTSIYNILLIHEPDYINNIDHTKFDLALAGHSHGGQVRFPLIGSIYKVQGAKKYYDGYYKVNDTDLYISSGLGTTLLKFRLLNPPSFNFYRIVKK